jgi:arginyl-tRNA synthetase
MLFDPKESLAFNGSTGPYLQYMGARICSILKKADGINADGSREALALLTHDDEWALIKLLGGFPQALCKAGEKLDPSIMAAHIYETAKAFGKFYHECPIVGAQNSLLAAARLFLAKCALITLKKGMELILVPFVQSM